MSLQSGIYSLAPNWSQKFSNWDKLKRFQKEELLHELRYSNMNIIAEARGFETSYYDRESPEYCAECCFYSYSYFYVINGPDMVLDREILELKGRQFTEHFQGQHNGIH